MEDKHSTLAAEFLTPAELIKKHNSDPTHVISDDEMKNLIIGAKADSADEFVDAVEDKLAEDEMDHHHANNPYDILDI